MAAWDGGPNSSGTRIILLLLILFQVQAFHPSAAASLTKLDGCQRPSTRRVWASISQEEPSDDNNDDLSPIASANGNAKNNPHPNWLPTLARRILSGPFPALRRVAAHHTTHNNKTDNNDTTALSFGAGVSWRHGIAAVVAYLLLGAVAYHQFLEPEWTLVDALYFSCTCFTTVGFGDMTLSDSAASKIFTTLYGLGGIAGLTSFLATVGSSVWQVEQQALQKAREQSRTRVKHLFHDMHHVLKKFKNTKSETAEWSNSTATVATATHEPSLQHYSSSVWNHPWAKMTRQMILHSLPSLITIMAGGWLFNCLNGNPWSVLESIYFSFVTASTIGFGDLSAQTQAARLFAVFYLPLAVACAGEVFSTLALIVSDRKQQVLFEQELQQHLTLQHLRAMDADGSGQVTREEYVAFMLLEMGRVDAQELAELHQQFQALDVTRSGVLDKEDLRLMAELKGTRVEEAVVGSDEQESDGDAGPIDGGYLTNTKSPDSPLRPTGRSDTSLKMSSSGNTPEPQSTTREHSLVVLIPAYNEELRIGGTLQSYHKFLSSSPQWKDKSSILVADDGSLDNTANVVEQIASEIAASSTTNIPIRCISLPHNGGKGAALAFGMQEIARQDSESGPLVLTTDADGSAPAKGIDDMYQALMLYWNENMGDDERMEDHAIVVAGCRSYQSAALSRLVFRWGFRTVVKLVCGNLGVEDSQCGFKLFTLPAAQVLYEDLNLPGWSHDVEVLYRAKHLNIPVLEQDTAWQDKDGSKLVASPGGVIWVCAKMFAEVCKLRWGYEGGGDWRLPTMTSFPKD